MALEKYVSERRLARFKSNLDSNGYKNVIEKIKVNGNEQTIDETDKSVNIGIPVTYNGSFSGANTGFRFYGTTDNKSGGDAQTEINGTSSNEDYILFTHRELEPISGGTVDLFEREIATTVYVNKKAPVYSATDDDFSIRMSKDGTPHGQQTTISANNTDDKVVFTHEIRDSQGTTALQFTKDLATTNYVDQNGGKIDKIKVNGAEQTISNKEVDLTVPTMNGSAGDFVAWNGKTEPSERVNISLIMSNDDYVDLETKMPDGNGAATETLTHRLVNKGYVDSTFRTEAQVAQQIAEAQIGAFVRVDSYNDLPSEGAAGKIYLVPNSGSGQNVYDEYIWCVIAMMAGGGGGESPVYGYEKIGTTAVDLSGYVQESDLVEVTEAEIDAMFA